MVGRATAMLLGSWEAHRTLEERGALALSITCVIPSKQPSGAYLTKEGNDTPNIPRRKEKRTLCLAWNCEVQVQAGWTCTTGQGTCQASCPGWSPSH